MEIYSEALLDAHTYYLQKDYKKALSIYDEVVRKVADPSVEILKEYALCLQKVMRYEESIKLTEKMLKNEHIDTDMLLNMCICWGKLGSYEKALDFYNRILKIDKNYKIQIGYYAYLLGRNGEIEKSDYFYNLAMKYEPDNMWYVSHYAFFLQTLKKYSEAERYYKKAIENDADNSWILKRYMYLICEMNGIEAAYSFCDDLIKCDLSNYNYYINAAELAIVTNNRKLAFNYLNRTEKLNKPLVIEIILLFYWGVYYICIRKYEKLEEIIGKLQCLRKNHAGFIHRDLTDLEIYIKRYMDDFQRMQYMAIFNVLSKGGE